MEQAGVIRRVDHHNDWCSSITMSIKKNGLLCICFDAKRLNNNQKCCPHKIPTLEITPQLTKYKYSSKLDAKAGYWSVHLTEDLQELTTFRTQFG